MREQLVAVLEALGPKKKVCILPPDFTRFHSQAGILTQMVHDHYGEAVADIRPCLGTHAPVSEAQREKMFGSIPADLFRVHDWREDVVTIGEVPEALVKEASGGHLCEPWPAQLNKLVWEGGHDLVISIGQVVPHEVMGMANYNKNLFVGVGGAQAINLSHFIGAVYGMERMMGRADNPLRRVLHYASDHFLKGKLPILYVLTVVGPDDARSPGGLAVRGLFTGHDVACFNEAAALSLRTNFTLLDAPLKKVVVFLDPEEFHSTWLGNKSIYRTRMAIADGGELVVLAPGVKMFGEDQRIDELIRKYGYRTTPEIMAFLKANKDLMRNLSAAAHLIHGTSEGRFKVTYCPGHLTREEVEGVGYAYADLAETTKRYDPAALKDGMNTMPDGEEVFYVSNPALGLWAYRGRFEESEEAPASSSAAAAGAAGAAGAAVTGGGDGKAEEKTGGEEQAKRQKVE